jgi:signal transduction histidine kinase
MTCVQTKIGTLIRDASERSGSAFPEMDLRLEIDENLPSADVDATRISQVLDNLLSNAYKYAPGSTVVISVKNDDGNIRIEVKDFGPGIPTEHIPHLFERFFRVPGETTSVRGTGLGLYICRKIVEAHGGKIGLYSKVKEGSTFYFTLPVIKTAKKNESERDDD